MKKRTDRLIAIYEDNRRAHDLLEAGSQLPHREAIAYGLVRKLEGGAPTPSPRAPQTQAHHC